MTAATTATEGRLVVIRRTRLAGCGLCKRDPASVRVVSQAAIAGYVAAKRAARYFRPSVALAVYIQRCDVVMAV